ncbi:hypothetical protein MML48_1g16121 [Holotrichia oblita]|uniref:Uncharacterized protein n=1 Tax=Holotrichia oblita TaxID=644536 RepID=A0ACB9TTG8_HOLOL|nr:hypothetical protein MML48_1g16121 [Holotrichia oblita]
MAVSEGAMIFMSIGSPEKRSISPISPITPSPSRGIKGIRLFRAISKKLARRSQEDLGEDDNRSSSTDSCSSTTISRCSRSRNLKQRLMSSEDSGFTSISPHHLSNSSVSDTGSSLQVACQHRHSSADSIRRVFQNLTINGRSKSCSNNNSKEKKKSKKNPPKRILRPPVRYIYMKGWSGLPTQRIPITISRSYVNNPCGYSMHYMTGLNR